MFVFVSLTNLNKIYQTVGNLLQKYFELKVFLNFTTLIHAYDV